MSIRTKDELITEFDIAVANGDESTAAEFRTLNENTVDSLDNFRTAYGDSKGTFKASGNSDLATDETGDLKIIAGGGALIQQEYDGANWVNVTEEIKSFDVTIPTASVLTLNATPITLVAAQGANTIIIPTTIKGQLIYGSAAFATNGDVSIYCGGNYFIGSAEEDQFLFGTLSRIVNIFSENLVLGVTDTQYVANQPMTIKVETGNPTVGTGSSIRIFGQYYVKNLG